ncbi:MAG TPA: Uma2 family endonuclease [Saprospiraceae bacterium]|nr:Uma2 family endonuclease [Saprospiraceae bacterium]HMP24919.1 Uma2 family endonuclease [Saprospiraceae bacterium]
MTHTHWREAILAQPDAVLILQDLQQALEAEKQQRAAYYALVHEDVKAEFINGEIVYQSPVKRRHWRVSMQLSALLHTYAQMHDLGEVGVEKVMVSLTRNDYEPNICFFGKAKAAAFEPDQMRFPAPDFVVEIISVSTEKRDREIKMQDYAAHGVHEYWIIDPEQQTVEQYFNQEGVFVLRQKLAVSGRLFSSAVTGFSVEITTLFA